MKAKIIHSDRYRFTFENTIPKIRIIKNGGELLWNS